MRARRPALVLAAIALVATGCGGGGVSAEEFCDGAQDLNDRFAALDELDPSDPAAFGELRDALDELDPPDEIAEDYDAVRDVVARFAELFEGIDTEDVDSLAQGLQDLPSEFSRVEAAGQRVEAYLRDECGIETDS